MFPFTRIRPLSAPISSADALAIGNTLATGFPCFVITIPSRSRWSKIDKHCSLNFAAATVFMSILYIQTLIMSTFGPEPG